MRHRMTQNAIDRKSASIHRRGGGGSDGGHCVSIKYGVRAILLCDFLGF
jgi:hypothetical protein